VQNAEPLVLGCSCIGGLHAGLACAPPGKIGRAINVFDATVNIRTGTGELLVLTLGATRSPMNLNVYASLPNAGFRDAVAANSDVTITAMDDRAALAVGRALVLLDGCGTFQNLLGNPSAGSLHTFAGKAGEVFSALNDEARERPGCLLRPDITTNGLLTEFLRRLLTGEKPGITDALLALCGRGPGFTPAGDDFIAGYLAISNWLSAPGQGPAVIPGSKFLRLTTWTSFKLMEYSARGLLDEQAQSMVNSVAAGRVEEFTRCIGKMSKKGHTSGLDFATGATVALYAAADRLLGMETLKGIAASGRLT
jgi:hypothetical protein